MSGGKRPFAGTTTVAIVGSPVPGPERVAMKRSLLNDCQKSRQCLAWRLILGLSKMPLFSRIFHGMFTVSHVLLHRIAQLITDLSGFCFPSLNPAPTRPCSASNLAEGRAKIESSHTANLSPRYSSLRAVPLYKARSQRHNPHLSALI
jgi:hypothetical protein